MPSKNTVKNYVKDGIYHIYNRGIDKRQIFMDDQDYKTFLYFLKRYLTPPEQPHQGKKSNFSKVTPSRSDLPPYRQSLFNA